ncbi:unnamed protein product [Cylindrotheca closterium]|uniref:G-protein coupled receptors family 1 profile domain-containing protein n=1 Tax=Cylindrotheca closterium TaxID=2856 RepID=A0AAD2FWG7_9STRA|nr:unnamed protein product [Cylindrotheca closterium]
MEGDQTQTNDVNTDSASNVSYLSDTQETALAFVPIVPTLISIWASCLLIRLLYKRGFKSPMRRILLALSITDIFTSVTAALQCFFVPRDTSRRLYAIGNDATCSYLGWGFSFSTISFFYYAALSFYFLMVVKFGMKDPVFGRRIEPYMHVSICIFSTATATIGLALGMYGEVSAGAGCWLRVTDKCDADCIHAVGSVFGGTPFLLCTVVVVAFNLLIFCHVRGTIYEGIKKSKERWTTNLKNLRLSLSSSKHKSVTAANAQAATRVATTTTTTLTNDYVIKQVTASPDQLKRVQRVGVQSLLYCLVFLVTYIWTVVLTTKRNNTANGGGPELEPALYPYMMLRATFIPLMGFWNLLVYVRQRYIALREQETSRENGESSLKSFRRVIWDVDAGAGFRKPAKGSGG